MDQPDTRTDGLGAPPSALADSLLGEIAERLATLASTGQASAIDLRSLPMTRADREALEQRLGRGDVVATLEVAGESELWETGYAGVWWVRHFGAGGTVATERIEITNIPDILLTHDSDIAAAADRLRDDLAAGGGASSTMETEHA